MAETLRDCPFLGIAHDPQTKTSFPSVMNCCHHAKPVAGVELSYQQVYCLTGKYKTCPVFMRDKKEPLPRELRSSHSQVSKQRKVRWPFVLMVIIVIIALVLTVLSLFFRDQLVIPLTGGRAVWTAEFAQNLPTATLTATQPPVPLPSATASVNLGGIASALAFTQTAYVSAEQSASPALTATKTQTPTQTATSTHTPTPTRTFTPTPTFTLTITKTPTLTPTQTSTRTATAAPLLRGLDTIIGKDHLFIIHKVQTGESLSQYASNYKTSIDAILRVNYSLNIPVWIDALVVIPVGFTDVAQMPYFQPSMVTTGGIAIEALAIELGTNLNDLIYYNDFKLGERLNMGDWVLIPRPKSAS